MSYIALKPVYLDDKEHAAGTVFETVPAELAEKLIARGTLAVNDSKATEKVTEVANVPDPLVVVPDVVENVSVNPTPEQINEDLAALEQSTSAPAAELNIQ